MEPRLLLSTTYLVDSAADVIAADGMLTLREAITAANLDISINEAAAGSGADVIRFAEALAGATITLGGTQLEVSSQIAIDGLGADQLSISGGGLSRVIFIGADGELTMSGVMLTDGYADEEQDGGGILNHGVLTLSNVLVTGNESLRFGGGVYTLGPITVLDSTFTHNTARYTGGGLSAIVLTAGQTSLIERSTFADNRTTESSGDRGGGGLGYTGSVTIRDSLFDDNTSAHQGGGLVLTGTALLDKVTVRNNTAQVNGGGVFISDFTDVEIIGGTIDGNQSTGSGGGIGANEDLRLLVTGTSITNNIAGSYGGGIRTAPSSDRSSTATLIDVYIAGNQAFNGGGVANESTSQLTLIGGTIENNIATADGGGVFNGGQNTSTISDTVIRNNTAAFRGGGILQNRTGSLTVTNALLSGNDAVSDGVAIMNWGDLTLNQTTVRDHAGQERSGRNIIKSLDGVLQIIETTVTDNQSIRPVIEVVAGQALLDGAMISNNVGTALVNRGVMEVRDTTVESNQTAIGPGPGIVNYGEMTLLDSVIARNVNTDGYPGFLVGRGAGVAQVDGDMTMARTLIEENQTTYGGGGGMYVSPWTSATIIDSTIRGNIDHGSDDEDSGGGLRVDGVATVIGTTFAFNSADYGGGVMVSPGAVVTISNSTVQDNEARSSGGGIMVSHGATLTLRDSTVADNSADANGGGLYLERRARDVVIERVTIVGNDAAIGGGVYVGIDVDSVTIRQSSIDDNHAKLSGGGVEVSPDNEAVTIDRTTIAGNISDANAGGVAAYGASLFITNSTISGNTASFTGGGFLMEDMVHFVLAHSTVANNRADIFDCMCGTRGAGIVVQGVTTLTHSIIADNYFGSDVQRTPNDVDLQDANIVEAVYNLIGATTEAGGLVNGVGGNQIGTPANPIPAMLGPLDDHGGSTRTHTLLVGSPAIDGGDPSFLPPPDTDQRGMPRVTGAAIDIGAFETQALRLVVTVLDDEVDGDFGPADLSLREAIILSNQNPGSDTIIIPTGTYMFTRSGGGAETSPDATVGDLDLTDETGATILGATAGGDPNVPLADRPVIDAAFLDRIFDVAPGAKVELTNLVLTRGSAPATDFDSGDGGAVRAVGSVGAVFESRTDTHLTLVRTELRENVASRIGGGVYITGDSRLLITDSAFVENRALSAGGGVYADTTRAITVERAVFENNVGMTGSGGMHVARWTTISDSVFRGNDAGTGRGGALSMRTNLTMRNVIIEHNTASHGGGIWLQDSSNLVLLDSIVHGNSATLTGGGISGIEDADLTIARTDITENTAGTDGGGIYAPNKSDRDSTAAILTDVVLARNFAGNSGGGAFNLNSMTVASSIVQDNVASRDGGGFFNEGRLDLIESIVRDNVAAGDGGGVYGDGAVNIVDSTIRENEAQRGGGIAAAQGASVHIAESALIFNEAEADGGAMFVFAAVNEVNLTNVTISGNTAATTGGGISSFDVNSVLSITHSTITDNLVRNGAGGGLYLIEDAHLRHSIVAANQQDDFLLEANDIVGALTPTSSFNLIGVGDGVVGVSDGVQGNQVGTAADPINPLLGPLTENGGPTVSHMPQETSPAINGGDPDFSPPPYLDQRGATRIGDGRIDIGAVESDGDDLLPPIIVTTLADEFDGDVSAGNISLREAIDLANRIAGLNIIRFDPSLAGGTLQYDDELDLGEMIILDDVHILGDGTITIDGDDEARIFRIDAGQVLIADLTLLFGAMESPDADNGGIILNHGVLTLDRMVLRNGYSDDDGGAVYNAPGAMLTVLDSHFIDNDSTGGGAAIANAGEMNILRSRFENNDTDYDGGAVFNAPDAVATIADTVFINNQAGEDGGAIRNEGDLHLTGVTFENNVAGERGGAIDNGGQLFIADSDFTGNQALDAGGAISQLPPGVAVVTGSTFTGNHAHREQGGGIYNNGVITLTDSTLIGNTAGDAVMGYLNGGGLFNGDQATILRTQFSDNVARYGGGIYNQGAMTIEDSILHGNRADAPEPADFNFGDGAAIHQALGGTLTVIDTTIADNHADGAGGGIYAAGGEVTITGSTIDGNSGYTPEWSRNRGGGVSVHGGSLIIHHSVFTHNTTPGFGGGVLSFADMTTITDSFFDANHAGHFGGGIATGGENTVSNIHNVVVTNNTTAIMTVSGFGAAGIGIVSRGYAEIHDSFVAHNVSGGEAGGIGGLEDTVISINNTTIADNHAAQSGGGVRNPHVSDFSTAMTLIDSRIIGNTAGQNGGGIDNGNGGTITLIRTTVAENNAGESGGGLYAALQSTTTVRDSALHSNMAQVNGGGVAIQPQVIAVQIINSTLSGNIARDYGGGIYSADLNSAVTILNSTITQNIARSSGGGLYLVEDATLHHTVVAGNHVDYGNDHGFPPGPSDIDGAATPASSFNLIGEDRELVGIADGEQGNQVGTFDSPLDPKLSPLGDYGGPTLTHVPRRGSPLIDRGNAAFNPNSITPPLLTDQRGLTRIANGNGALQIDIGSVEVLLGDVNHDGLLNAADIDDLYAAIARGDTTGLYDLNADDLLDQHDVDFLVRNLLFSQYGDADLDLDVDIEDLSVVAAHFGSSTGGWAQGNFDGKPGVTISDLARLATYFGFDYFENPGAGAADPDAADLLAEAAANKSVVTMPANGIAANHKPARWAHIAEVLNLT